MISQSPHSVYIYIYICVYTVYIHDVYLPLYNHHYGIMLILLSVAPAYSIGYSNPTSPNLSDSLSSGITVESLAISGTAQSLFVNDCKTHSAHSHL